MNESYPFADPVVVLGGDFNTVDPLDIENAIKRESLIQMLDSVNGIGFCDTIKNNQSGVCAFISENIHHGGYKYYRV
jgi:hypothetical protein